MRKWRFHCNLVFWSFHKFLSDWRGTMIPLKNWIILETCVKKRWWPTSAELDKNIKIKKVKKLRALHWHSSVWVVSVKFPKFGALTRRPSNAPTTSPNHNQHFQLSHFHCAHTHTPCPILLGDQFSWKKKRKKRKKRNFRRRSTRALKSTLLTPRTRVALGTFVRN